VNCCCHCGCSDVVGALAGQSSGCSRGKVHQRRGRRSGSCDGCEGMAGCVQVRFCNSSCACMCVYVCVFVCVCICVHIRNCVRRNRIQSLLLVLLQDIVHYTATCQSWSQPLNHLQSRLNCNVPEFQQMVFTTHAAHTQRGTFCTSFLSPYFPILQALERQGPTSVHEHNSNVTSILGSIQAAVSTHAPHPPPAMPTNPPPVPLIAPALPTPPIFPTSSSFQAAFAGAPALMPPLHPSQFHCQSPSPFPSQHPIPLQPHFNPLSPPHLPMCHN